MSRRLLNAPHRQRGIGLATAIFVITVMIVLIVAINRLMDNNARGFEEEVLLTRAFHAAESGAGFALNRLFPPTGYPDYLAASCPALTEYEAFVAQGLETCRVSVTCDVTEVENDDGDPLQFYNVISTGTCGDVQRRVQVQSRFEP